MFIKKEGDFVKLIDTLTLFQIRDMYWKENKPIELYFLLVEQFVFWRGSLKNSTVNEYT